MHASNGTTLQRLRLLQASVKRCRVYHVARLQLCALVGAPDRAERRQRKPGRLRPARDER
jgi:hypothetical protein